MDIISHRRRSLDNFRGEDIFPRKNAWKIKKCRNFTWFLPEKKYQKYPNFYIFPKINNFPNFTWFLPEKKPEF